MRLDGSCHCGAVRFSVQAPMPVPFMLCYCSICRKTAGGGGFAINLGARASTLEVQGGEYVSVYHAMMREPGERAAAGVESPAARHFCSRCGSALWLFDPRWPELVHPHASAIDTPLPLPPQRVHLMEGSRANWAAGPQGPDDLHYPEYPEESLDAWHRRHGLLDDR